MADANYSRRITNKEDKEFLILIIERLTRIKDSMHINRTKVIVSTDEEVNLLDPIGKTAQYQPITIIHYIRVAIDDTTRTNVSG